MASPGSIIIAHWFLAPATLFWCRLLMDNPGEQVLRAWSRALLNGGERIAASDSVGQTPGAAAASHNRGAFPSQTKVTAARLGRKPALRAPKPSRRQAKVA